MRKVLFVTNELFPMSRGGIGRFIYNYIMWNAASPEPDDLQALMLDQPRSSDWADDAIAGVTLHDAEALGTLNPHQRVLLRSGKSAAHKALMEESLVAANAIERLYENFGLVFDAIEFPDFRGLACASIQRKLEGAEAFRHARLVVRLHSSMTLIQADEGAIHYPSEWFAAVCDIERYSLRYADLIVGHLDSVVELNRRQFGFDKKWAKRTVVEFPPILLTPEERIAADSAARAHRPGPAENQTFVFSSRLQTFKRPDLFLRAAAAFLRRHPERQDRFVVMSYGWDKAYVSWLKSLIPDDLGDLIQIRTDFTSTERAALLAAAIIVIPSSFESLCIFAYESLLSNRRLILNAACVAFGQAPFWRDGQNCLLFEGTVEDLREAMERSLSFVPSVDIALPPSNPYWRGLAVRPAAKRRVATLDLVVSGVATGRVDPSQAEAFLAGAGIGLAFLFKDRLYDPTPSETPGAERIVVIESYGAAVDSGALRKALTMSTADYVVFAPPACVPSASWREQAGAALAASDADLIGFTTVETPGGARRASLLDCPNLLALNLDFQLLPVAVRRSAALDQLGAFGCEQDWLVERIVLALALRGAKSHVLDLPVQVRRPPLLHRHPLHHYVTDLLATERRKATPHLAAYVGLAGGPAGRPYTDEWAVLPRPAGLLSTDPAAVPLVWRGVSAAGVRLRNAAFPDDAWEVQGVLEDVMVDGARIGSIDFRLGLDKRGLEIRLGEHRGEFPTAPEGAASETTSGQLSVRSWRATLPAALDGASAQGNHRLRLLRMLSEQVPLWCAGTFRQAGLMMDSSIEDRLMVESARLAHIANCALQISGAPLREEAEA